MDWENYLRFVLALLFVLGMIGGLATVVRRYGYGMSRVAMRKGDERRLNLVEVLALDAKRRAVLIRRDEVEHLVILGPESETVVEINIAPPAAKTSESHSFSEVLETAQAEKTE